MALSKRRICDCLLKVLKKSYGRNVTDVQYYQVRNRSFFFKSHTRGLTLSHVSLGALDARERLEHGQELASASYAQSFEQEIRSKVAFHKIIRNFVENDPFYRRGHVEFILAGMKSMKAFGVHKDLETYKLLIDVRVPLLVLAWYDQVFPKNRMIPRNAIQAEFFHFPKQQDCLTVVLDEMSWNSVIPDDELGGIIVEIFGTQSWALRKYQSTMFWSPRFKNASVYPVPRPTPRGVELAVAALKRMCPDISTEYNVIRVEGNTDGTTTDTREADGAANSWIANAQSGVQRELIELLPPKHNVRVEGPFRQWMREKTVSYFQMRALSLPEPQKPTAEPDLDPLLRWKPFYGQEDSMQLERLKTVHEQDDGIILALCVLEDAHDRIALFDWVSYLTGVSPHLERVHISFDVKSSDRRRFIEQEQHDSPSPPPGSST